MTESEVTGAGASRTFTGSGRRSRPTTAAEAFAARLLRWFDVHRRDLPWRRTRDPWAIWVSEVMLQQTRVEAVREPFVRFLASFPTPAAFAAASDDQLLLAWRGLGYYRRARLLREGARQVTAEHGGRVPEAPDALRALPGVGDYTCGAVASIAFGHAVVAIDGNVERVVARHRGVEAMMGTGAGRRAAAAVVRGWQEPTRAGDFNQALMELGAMICTPSSPECPACPVAADCVARTTGRTAELPVRKAPPTAVEVTARVVVVRRGERLLGYRIPGDQPNSGQVELPGPGVLRDCDQDDLAGALAARFDARVTPGAALTTVRHTITCHRITLHAHAASVARRGRLEWFAVDDDTPWTTPSRKVFARLGGAGQVGA